jgi:uncharacterized protein (DUF2249 family)
MEHRLDVSMLEPCEPLERTLEAIRRLGGGDYLRLIHRREPNLLYPLLRESGFVWHCCAGGPSGFQIFIWREGDRQAALAAAEGFTTPC